MGQFSVQLNTRMQLISLAPRYAKCQRVSLLFPTDPERDPKLLALAAECRMYKNASA
jgi:LysR family malonate utilization transcriptional regulator